MEKIKELCGSLFTEVMSMHQRSYQSGFDDGYEAGFEKASPKYPDGKKLVIPLADENFGNVLALAVRQALMEPAAAMQMIHFVKPLLQYLSYQTLWTMDRDISHHILDCSTDEMKLWKKFVVHVRVQMNHKKP